MFSPMPTWTASSGPSSAPATPQSAAPMPKTIVNSRGMSVPIAVAISRSEAPARTSAPIRVFCTKSHSSSASARPMPRISSRYAGYCSPGSSSTGPASAAGAASGRSLPKTILVPSLRIRISAKVASTCERWSRA